MCADEGVRVGVYLSQFRALDGIKIPVYSDSLLAKTVLRYIFYNTHSTHAHYTYGTC